MVSDENTHPDRERPNREFRRDAVTPKPGSQMQPTKVKICDSAKNAYIGFVSYYYYYHKVLSCFADVVWYRNL